MISMGDGTFVFILLFVGFKIETNVGINKIFDPIWISGMIFVLCARTVQIWCSSFHFSKFSSAKF